MPLPSPCPESYLADLQALFAQLGDRYSYVRDLGRGGMATVVLARDLRHKREVAFKLLDPEVGAAVGSARFLREIETAARLQHPHILPVFDSGETAGQLWYTMPYVTGESLRDRLGRENRLPIAEVVRLGREIAEALQAAHQVGIVHRDIKPENVLLSHGHALVADFGIARTAHADAGSTLTQTGLSLGTPAYMSPEQALGDSRAVDGRSDIYSLGCLMYELLAGSTPFAAPSAQAMVAAHLTQPVADVRQARPDTPAGVAAALSRALAKSPEERFATAAAFAEALSGGETRSVSPPAGHRRPRAVAILAAGAALLAVAGGWAALRQRAADPEAPTRLAVLPFHNLGDTADAYFAAGLASELRARLAAVRGLEVIGTETSTAVGKESSAPAQVARTLGVRYVLVGQVQWRHDGAGGGSLRVRPELVDGKTGATTWGKAFDGSAADLFQVQGDIAGRVAEALGVALGKEAVTKLGARAPPSSEGFDAYLRARAALDEWYNLGQSARLADVRRYAAEAVARDSTFGPGWALLATAQIFQTPFGCRSCATADSGRAAAELALSLDPDRPEGYLALGRYWAIVADDPKRSLDAVEAGLRRLPTDPDLLSTAAWRLAVLGDMDRALAYVTRAESVDPRSRSALQVHARLLVYLHRYDELRALCRRGLAFAPRYTHLIAWQMIASLMEGDSTGARQVFERGSPALDLASLTIGLVNLFQDILVWPMPAPAKEWIASQPLPASVEDRISLLEVRAVLRQEQGDTAAARRTADSAVAAFDATYPDSSRDGLLHAFRGQLLSYAGRRAAARTELTLASRPGRHRDAFFDPVRHEAMASAFVALDQPEAALDLLEPLVRQPYWLTPAWLRISPTFANLRGHPRFERLVGEPGQGTAR